MKLKEVNISDYRSIVQGTISFNEGCIGLIGLNESGKSNILNAVRIIERDRRFNSMDISKVTQQYPKVTFHFSVDGTDHEEMFSALYRRLILDADNRSKVDAMIRSVTELVYEVASEEDGTETYTWADWTSPHTDGILKGVLLKQLKSGESIEQEHVVEIDELGKFQLNRYELFLDAIIPADLRPKFEDADSKLSLLTAIKDDLDEKLPSVVFWEYTPQYLLPSEIEYDAFIKDDKPQTNSAPFYNILLLTPALGIKSSSDLTRRVSVWKKSAGERRKDSSLINDSINSYIKKIWPDYDQELNVELEQSRATIHITDPISPSRNYYEMESRSQGCKTFLSFILTIAAETEQGTVRNCILLLDEPETHLHPSGVRHMKEELLQMAKAGNYVLFATHSVFMIDRKNLKRHLIVSKDKEVTQIKPVERNNFIQEAVLYAALGTSVDEFAIGMRNVIFEGELDLKMFAAYLDSRPADVGSSGDYQLWDGGGVKKIEMFLAQRMLPRDSRWLVVLDNDSPGQGLQKNIREKLSQDNYSIVPIMYSDIHNYEIEDALPLDIIIKALDAAAEVVGISVPEGLLDGVGVISPKIDGFAARNISDKNQKSTFEKVFKETLAIEVENELASISQRPIGERYQAFLHRFDKYSAFSNTLVQSMT
jgi:AAA15 family ATPase/GTPase